MGPPSDSGVDCPVRMHHVIPVKVVWTTQNAQHVAKHGVARKTVEEIFEAADAVIVAGQPKGRWVIEATVDVPSIGSYSLVRDRARSIPSGRTGSGAGGIHEKDEGL